MSFKKGDKVRFLKRTQPQPWPQEVQEVIGDGTVRLCDGKVWNITQIVLAVEADHG